MFGSEVARALEQGSFSRLRRAFPGLDEAFGLFASTQSCRYSLAAATAGPCRGCGGGDALQVARAEWDFQFPSLGATAKEVAWAIGHVHQDQHRHGRFATYHGVCGTCWKRWWACRVAGMFVQGVGGVGVALGMVFALLGSVFYVGGTFSPSDRRQMPLWIAAGLAAAVAGVLLWVLGLRWRIPSPLRRVAGRPITLEKLQRRDGRQWQFISHIHFAEGPDA